MEKKHNRILEGALLMFIGGAFFGLSFMNKQIFLPSLLVGCALTGIGIHFVSSTLEKERRESKSSHTP
jgi:hypothetical protein